MRHILVLIAAIFLFAPAHAAAPDWTRTVTMTADGAYVLGNPAAPTRITEYLSYTCPHCAHFVAEARAPLKDRVRRGLVRVELRNAIRDAYDLTAAILARCGGKARVFADSEALFAQQAAWLPRVQAYENTRGDKAFEDTGARLNDIAAGTGLTGFMAKRGLKPEVQRQCLADKRTQDLLAAMAEDAWQDRKIGGTPSLAVNGRLLPGVHDWAGLNAALNAALPAPSK
jgi:protein-disulfide isomerase